MFSGLLTFLYTRCEIHDMSRGSCRISTADRFYTVTSCHTNNTMCNLNMLDLDVAILPTNSNLHNPELPAQFNSNTTSSPNSDGAVSTIEFTVKKYFKVTHY